MSVDSRWESEDGLVADVRPPNSKIENEGEKGDYEPFADPDVSFDVTKWPAKKPAPTTTRAWDDKTSAPAGTVQGDTKATGKETR